ncbi:PREDICTED: thiosulfate sulfurtransferase/rhodanese-like domain-containing protein 3 [Dufourea novaeangliae]|uniref:Putative thiosulfate sulfurtransferase, mitochondrial n=1 Tax=Dufourea novaeangliae TaxID=178035 RepID=A0A154PRW2_DUFNO|nr:PREDICTED: thiosulfate sulfurtransferase/rhodanese-like domain-containing protein 3 [Dufourea novaeangliae]KZC13850.1 Putative thiosulfate sulfurtransferase, mitochondrial [Dufourea novaeangliae]
MAEGDKKDLSVYYKDILEAQKDNNVLIIDVREQNEINETGKLPGSIHIPMGNVSNVLSSLSPKDFRNTFDKEKPSKDTKIILSCRSGKRSAMVQEEIQKLGYQKAYNYVGGWLDWENNQKV